MNITSTLQNSISIEAIEKFPFLGQDKGYNWTIVVFDLYSQVTSQQDIFAGYCDKN